MYYYRYVNHCYVNYLLMIIHAGADPEDLHGRWLIGWLPILNYTTAEGVAAWLIMVDISYTMLHKRTGEGGWLATLRLSNPPPPQSPPDMCVI